MKITTMVGAAVAVSMGGYAVADIPLAFELDGPGGNMSEYFLEMQGSLDGFAIDVDFTNEGGWTWAGDLWIGIVDPNGNAMQFGGYDHDDGSPNAGDFPSSWDSSTSGAYAYNASLAAMGLSGSGVWAITFLDGYSSGAATDNWTGILDLQGVEAIPAPGALALLGLGGLAARRRRNG